jgi:hypothetical protein
LRFKKYAFPRSRELQGRWLRAPLGAASDIVKTGMIEEFFVVAGKPNPSHGGRNLALSEPFNGEVKYLFVLNNPLVRMMKHITSHSLNIVVPI